MKFSIFSYLKFKILIFSYLKLKIFYFLIFAADQQVELRTQQKEEKN